MYHICKQTRVYDSEPYCGYSSNSIPAQSESLEEATQMVKKMTELNPIGWNIFDSETWVCVYGVDAAKGFK